MAWKDLFSTGFGLLTLFTIAFVLEMRTYTGRFVKSHVAEDERTHGYRA